MLMSFRLIFVFLIVVACFVFVTYIIRMALEHHEKITRIKHGKEIDESKPHDDFVDYRNNNQN